MAEVVALRGVPRHELCLLSQVRSSAGPGRRGRNRGGNQERKAHDGTKTQPTFHVLTIPFGADELFNGGTRLEPARALRSLAIGRIRWP